MGGDVGGGRGGGVLGWPGLPPARPQPSLPFAGPHCAHPHSRPPSIDRSAQPLVQLMREIGGAAGGKSASQVALNWVMAKGGLPIPGAKTVKQVQEIAGAMGWQLSAGEVAALDKAGKSISTMGAPFENW